MRVSAIKVVKELCTGCESCIAACPYQAIAMKDGTAEIALSHCTLCGACVDACPAEAIVLSVERRAVQGMESYDGIWVLAEQREGKVQSVVYEMIGAGLRLAKERQTRLSVVVLGHGMEAEIPSLFQHGVDRVYLADHPALKEFCDESYSRILSGLAKQHKPEIILAGATSLGRSLMPRTAVELNTGLTADCTGLEIDSETGHLLQTRPAFGGNIMATILCSHHRPQMATVRHKVMPEPKPDPSRTGGEIIRVELKEGDTASRTRVLESVKEAEETVKITEADIIVSGGRGLKGPEHFGMLADLAKVLGGAVGASRAAVDSGWIGYSHQVGQTGKTVKPKIYFAVGISGAIQHLVGISSADVIIAINKNPDAPIFSVADYGIVGDLFEIVPELTKRFKAVMKK